MTASGPQKPAKGPAVAAQPIAIVRSYADLRRAVADWCDHIGMTRAGLDTEAALADGHSSKLLSARAIKKFGNVTLGRVLAATGTVLVLAQDGDAAPAYAGDASEDASEQRKHWRTNKGPAWGRRMAALRALKQSAAERSEIARKAAQARWQRRQIGSNSAE